MSGAFIIGAGPGIGMSVARRFAAAGMPVGLIARTAASIGGTRAAVAAAGVTVAGATADAGQDDQLTAALEYGPSGVHVATVTVAGAVAPGSRFDPDRIAERYWRLHAQSPGAWEHEVVFTG
jgi:NADP-dependent 3-hydroxy acid dehydrogenase YdfG